MLNKLKSKFPYPRFQLTFILLGITGYALILGTFYYTNVYAFHQFILRESEFNLAADHAYLQFLTAHLGTMKSVFTATFALGCVAIPVAGTILSRRAVERIYQLRKLTSNVIVDSPRTPIKFQEDMDFTDSTETEVSESENDESENNESEASV